VPNRSPREEGGTNFALDSSVVVARVARLFLTIFLTHYVMELVKAVSTHSSTEDDRPTGKEHDDE